MSTARLLQLDAAELATARDAERELAVVWPLLGAESESDDPSPLERIKETLREVGVEDIQVWTEVNEPEFCEDCGAPLYPSPSDEVVHVEMPEDTEPASTQFH